MDFFFLSSICCCFFLACLKTNNITKAIEKSLFWFIFVQRALICFVLRAASCSWCTIIVFVLCVMEDLYKIFCSLTTQNFSTVQ